MNADISLIASVFSHVKLEGVFGTEENQKEDDASQLKEKKRSEQEWNTLGWLSLDYGSFREN